MHNNKENLCGSGLGMMLSSPTKAISSSNPLEKCELSIQLASLTCSLETVYMPEVKSEERHESIKHRVEKRKYIKDNGEQLWSSKRRCGDHIDTSRSTGDADDADAISVVPSEQIDKHLSFASSKKTELKHRYPNHSNKIERPKLVLDLDHTLIDSTQLMVLSLNEVQLVEHIITKKDEGLLHRLDFVDCYMLVKLRPFVRQFLRETNDIFNLYVYAMGTQTYATEVIKLLDPENKCFPSKIISEADYTRSSEQKALDVVSGSKTGTIILDDKLSVWKEEDRENIIEMERYNFFASSCQRSRSACKSLAELRTDEREADGTLASILSVLKCAYQKFFLMDQKITESKPDFRIILKKMRSEILTGCVVTFIGMPPYNGQGCRPLRRVAEQLGAKCCIHVDASVTHILAVHSGAHAMQPAQNGKFLVRTDWLMAGRYLWRRLREEDFLLVPTA